jgi:hypothetical protein
MGLVSFTAPEIWETITKPGPDNFVLYLKIDLQEYIDQIGLNVKNEDGSR